MHETSAAGNCKIGLCTPSEQTCGGNRNGRDPCAAGKRVVHQGHHSTNEQDCVTENIRQLFNEYKISRTDFEDEEIERLVRLRDEIVHTGEIPDGMDIWPSIILLRELITRILLKEIGFVGRYCCYVGGRHYRDFPGDGKSPETA